MLARTMPLCGRMPPRFSLFNSRVNHLFISSEGTHVIGNQELALVKVRFAIEWDGLSE